MNILFFADPNSIHDEKWISYFSDIKGYKTFILPRAGQINESVVKSFRSCSVLLDPIVDFSIVRFYQTIITAFRIKSILKKEKIDLIHILYAEPNSLWCLFRFFFKVPMIVSSRGTDVLKTIPEVFKKRDLINSLVGPAYRKAFSEASWITCTSMKQVKSISFISGRREKISIVRTGVDLGKLNQTAVLPTQLRDHKFILFPRYVKPIYNHEFCLEAIELLPKVIKQEYKMVFVGLNSGDLQYQQMLESKMQQMKEVEFVFIEKQGQQVLFELYKKASIVVMTPLSDGSPVSAMEAMLSGTRLLLGPLEYDEEIFSEATILQHWSAAELAESIQKALSKSAGKVALPQDKIQLMDRNYNMSLMDQIYKEILNGASR